MDAADWVQLSRLLDEVLDLPPAERTKWLAALTSQDAAFKPRLLSLLAQPASIHDGAFLDTIPKLDFAATEAFEETLDRGGATVGPYRLLRHIGEGGMGTVWLAERADGMVRRPVALKLPRRAWLHASLAERMARERDILAALAHPHIARLYDAGVTATGRPYLALEYIEGRPLDVYCRDQRLDVPARLGIFLQVVDAVAYAHGKLVVHRDLKPSNILVTAEGQVHLLDFGIAKLLDDGAADQTMLTEIAGRPHTPAYASPEQIAGEPLSVATDVYSLGVVLYELLAGTRPGQVERDAPRPLRSTLARTDVIPPSDAAGEPALRKALRGDLDTIVLKALKESPEERYPTANAFGDDLRRCLSGRPVAARPDGTWYRLSKFARRHALAVGAAVVALLAVLTGAGVAVWQWRVALGEQRRAEEVKEFVASIFRDADLDATESRSMSVLELLKQATGRIATLEAPPRVRVELLNLLGTGLLSLGDTDALEAVAARAVDEAARGLEPADPLTLRARILMAWTHNYRGKSKEMLDELEQTSALMQRDPDTFAGDLATIWRMRADHAIDAADYPKAEQAAKEAVARAEAAYGSRDQHTLLAVSTLTAAYRFNDKPAEALQNAERAQQLAADLFRNNPRHPYALHARAEYARALADNGRLSVAIDQLKRALEDAIQLYGPNGRTVGFHLQNLAGYELKLGQIHEAESTSARALAILVQHAQPGSMTAAAAENVNGKAQVAARRGAEALPVLTSVQGAAAKIFGPTHEHALGVRANRALVLGYAGRLAEATRETQATIAAMRGAGGSFLMPLYAAGLLQRVLGNHAAALELQREALTRVTDKPQLKLERAQVETAIGLALLEIDPEHAMAPLERARPIFRELEQPITPPHADALVGGGRLHLRAGRPADALPLLEEADRFWRGFDAESRWAGEAALWLGQCYAALNRAGDARVTLTRASRVLARSPLPEDARLSRLAMSRTPRS